MWGYTTFFLYSMGDVLHGGTQNLPYIIWEYTLAWGYAMLGEIMRNGTHNLSYILWECVTNTNQLRFKA